MPLFFAGFHILYITSTIFHYNWSISLKIIFLPLTCNGASSVSAPTDHYDGTGAIPRLVPWCANQRQPRHNQRSPDGRRTARCSEDQAHDHGGTVGKQRRVQLRSSCTSPAPAQLYRTLLLRLGTADPDLAGPCPWGSPSTPPNCFLISDRPNAAKVKTARMILSSLQMIIRRIRPLANDHPKGPASCK